VEITKTVRAMLDHAGFDSVSDIRRAAEAEGGDLTRAGRALDELRTTFRDLATAEADLNRALGAIASKAERERGKLDDGLTPGVEWIVQATEQAMTASAKLAALVERTKLLTYVVNGPSAS
jgi:hypothetical protein